MPHEQSEQSEQDERDKLIREIEQFFQADGHELGPGLLQQARDSLWRGEPTGVLREYHRLCIEEENRQANLPHDSYRRPF